MELSISPDIFRLTIRLFCVATMFTMGLGITLDDIRAPFTNILALVIIIVSNGLIVPLLGLAVVGVPSMLAGSFVEGVAEQIVPLAADEAAGFLLLMVASGSLFGPLLARVSGASEPFAKGIMVVFVGVSALVLPLAVSLQGLIPGDPIEFEAVFITLLLYQILPLALGVLIKVQFDRLAQLLRPLIVQFTSFTFLIGLGFMLSLDRSLISVPSTPPAVDTPELYSTTLQIPIETISGAEVLTAVEEVVTDDAFPTDARIEPLAEENSWVIFDVKRTFLITHSVSITEATAEANATLPATLTVSSTNPSVRTFAVVSPTREINNRVAELDSGQISGAWKRIFRNPPDDQSGIVLDADLVVTLEDGKKWAMVVGVSTYFVTAEDANGDTRLSIFQKLPEPLGILAEFVELLSGLPVIGPIVDFLGALVVVLVPYALFAAVTVLLLTIGNYTGVAVSSLVEVTGTTIPRTLATSTAVRNVSAALIVASEYGVNWTDPDPKNVDVRIVSILLIIFLVSVIIASIQAYRWGNEESEEGDA